MFRTRQASVWQNQRYRQPHRREVSTTPWQYNLTFWLLIIIFTYFLHCIISVNPNQIADDLKRSRVLLCSFQAVRPRVYFDETSTRVTLPVLWFY
jgi:preprotein translocase subunit SecY